MIDQAFPGWTLPGVITCGAALTLVKSQYVLPGRRVLVTGTGPLLLSSAAHLVAAGVEVVGVCETSRILPKGVLYAPNLMGQMHRMQEGQRNTSASSFIRKYPIGPAGRSLRAHGNEHVEEVLIGKVDWMGIAISAPADRTRGYGGLWLWAYPEHRPGEDDRL